MKINILAKKYLTQIKDSDIPINFYYYPLIKEFYLERLKAILALMGNERYKKILELGYGTGIFMPELSRRADELFGIDIKDNISLVSGILKENNVNASLAQGSILDLPYENGKFDCLVCVSVLEHIKELDKAVSEIRRVLNEKGTAYIGYPYKNASMDTFFRLAGYDPAELHPSSHSDIYSSIQKVFYIECQHIFRFVFPLYTVLKCRKI